MPILQNILYQDNKSKDRGYYRCPVCCNRTCEIGEVIEWYQIEPDHCWLCGWVQGNGTSAYADNYDYVNKCWEIQVAPYSDMGHDFKIK